MSDNDQHSNEPATVKYDWQPVWNWVNTTGFRLLIGLALIMAVGVILLAMSADSADTTANVLTVGILTILTVVVTAISAVATRQMVEIMRSQEAEMTKQREAMQGQLQRMEQQEARMIEQREIMQGQLEAAERQANSAKAQSEMMRETILQAREHFSMTNKPVIILASHFLKIEGGTFTGPVQVDLKMINTGNSIANNVSLRVHRAFLDKEQSDFVEKGAQPTGDIGETVNKGIVGNNGVFEHTTRPIDNQDGATFYVWGEIMYDDAFSDPTTYVTFFCLSARDGDKKLAYCRHWNKIGQMVKPDLSKIWNKLPIPDKTDDTDQQR